MTRLEDRAARVSGHWPRGSKGTLVSSGLIPLGVVSLMQWAVACGGESEGLGASGGTLLPTAVEYCAEVARTTCSEVAPCCGVALATCESTMRQACEGTAESAASEGQRYEPEFGAACAAGTAGTLRDCGYAVPYSADLLATARACGLVWRGITGEGEACADSTFCSAHPEQVLVCVGEPGATGVCSAVTSVAIGARCRDTLECPMGAFCDPLSGTCGALLADGAPCEAASDCSSQFCGDDGRCAMPDFALYCSLF